LYKQAITIIFTTLVLMFLLQPILVEAEEKDSNISFEYELDAYYSNVSWVKGFDNQDIPVVSNLDELSIYKTILQESLQPDFILFEASVNPLPVLGVFLRDQYPTLYESGNNARLGGNVIEAVTTGFEEPFALSVFAGRVLRFAPPDGLKTQGDDKGYIGYLLSVGSHHIQQNILIRDHWLELEWKVKGTRETMNQHLSWSFRAGAKYHSHPDIGDTLFVGARRDRIDFTKKADSFFLDLGFEYKLDVLQENFRPSKQTLIIDKHWPMYQDKLTFSLGFGAIWEGSQRYTGSLTQDGQRWSLILRPNIRF